MKTRFRLCRCTMFVAALMTTGLFAGAVRPVRQAGQAPLQLEVGAASSAVQWPMTIEDYVDADLTQIQAAPPPDEAGVYVDAAGRYSVLVHLDPTVKVRGMAGPGLVRDEVRNFSAARALDVHYEYDVLPNTLNLRGLTQADITDLKNLPGVVRVEMDELKHIYLHDSVPLINGLQSQITAAGLSARAGGVRVCVVDTGIRADHAMFVGKVDSAAGWDFYNNDSNPADDNGHGTNVSGIAAGLDGLSVNFGTCGSEPFQGVAVDATIIPVKVCSGSGSCPTSDIVAGINHCADVNLVNGQADVISMSLGGGQFSGTCDSDSSASAANNAVAAGVTVVAASGNDGFSNAMGSPACGSSVISVGAVYDTDFPNCQDSRTGFTWCLDQFCFSTCTDDPIAADDLVCFSNRSVNLDVTAPGCDIWSATNTGSTTAISSMCGTSQATPHVAGLAALILGKDPSLTPADVRQVLRNSAVDLGSPGFDSSYGFGRIDVVAALNMVGGGCTTNGECDDGLFCNGAETCDIPTGTCLAGTAPNCNDGVACTDDSCNEGTNSCDNIANNANCDDGLACNGVETCDAALDCQSGTPVNCNDGVACTTDACNEPGGTCSNTPNNAVCDNGLFCDGAETCDPALDCQSGTAVNCDDGVACTDDSCNETTDSCDNIANNANCDDGLFCNGAETCSATLDCQAGSDPCPGQICDEGTDTCNDCIINADCDDGLFCNGAETCVAGTCQAGTTVNCDDGVACTDDSCNEGTDSCDNVANNTNCDNGLFCDGAETCDAVLDCQAGTAVNCDDGVACTDDSCNEGTDSCDNTPNNANCDNGVFCDGAETCNATLDCQAGTPPTCDDGVACTDDSCNAGTDSCDNIANDANCDNGLFCDGAETCDAVLDCQAGADPCPGQGCDEANNQCLAGPTAQLEAGSVTVGPTAVTVHLTNTYVSPVVVCTMQYNNNTTPAVTRVTNVTSTSFDVYLQNPGDLATPVAENVSYLVVEEGTWTIDGVNVEAQTYLSTVTDENNSWVGQAQTYGQSYTNPVVVGQVMSVNDPDWSVFWCQGSARTNPPSASALRTGKHVAEDPVVPRANETIGFIVFESGHRTIGGVAFEAVLGPDTVLGVGDAPPYTYTFQTAFASAPSVGVVNIGGMDGGNGGWGQIHGPTLATTTLLNLSIDEDQINDAERNRTTDQIEYVVFETPVVYPAVPACTIAADCDDGLFCNGAEDCVAGSCVAGTPPNCGDGVACTDDTCNEATDSCDNTANDANCDDGLFCNGAETCDAVLDCQAGTAVNCDDGVACTDDSCNEGTDSCDNTPNNANCDNGVFCDGAETCDAVLDCQAGTPPTCDDGVVCTDDSCNAVTDSCDNIANDANCPDNGLFCDGTEFCDAVNDCSSTGDPCAVGEVCNETTDTCDPGTGARLESGSVTASTVPTTVTLVNTYASPVVVCSIQYNNNTIPVVPRVTNVTSTSFDVYLQGAGAGGVLDENVSYLVVEEGAWTIDGVNIEAQTYLSTVTDENNSWVGEAQTYLQSYTNPVVLGQVMSDNDADWSVFWDQGSSRGAPPTATTLRTGKTVCEDTLTTRADETVGFIVIEAGHGTLGGVEFEAALGADTVRGVSNAPPYTYTLNAAFATTPTIGIVTMAAVDGNNGGWAYAFGAAPMSTTSLDLVIDEDQIGDTERKHTTEQVGYIVFAGPAVSP